MFRSITILLCLTFCLTLQATGKRVLTLGECFEKALKRSESLAIREEAINTAEAHYLQALGTTLPHLNLRASETIQDTTTSGSGGTIADTFTRRSRPEVAVTLKQPLFQGLREFRALAVSNAEKKKNTFERDRARQILFTDVARAYFTVLELENEVQILDSILETLRQRTLEIHQRVKLGKSRESEILAVESEAASVEAERENRRGLVETARDLLGFFIGESIQGKLVDDLDRPSPLKPLETYVDSLRSRPDIRASAELVRLAQGKLSYEKGGRMPFVDLEANYYPYRVGFLSDINWDLLFTLNFPIFQGGATKGKINEAKATLKETELTKSESLRQADLEIRQAYHDLTASQAQEQSLRQAESKAAANYKAQSEDYRLGLINNLELLQTLRDWQEKRQELNRVSYQSKLDLLQFQTAAGENVWEINR